MRITFKRSVGQLICFKCSLFLLLLLILSSCTSNKEESPVIPPVTSPLTRDYIGYGVITASFTHINEDPSEASSSLGYLRRGSLVRIVRRQVLNAQDGFTSWVLTDGEQQGWLKEDVIDIYTSQRQAMTASESMLK